jgi:3-phosphoshikimate 1-carboxyvinyltransferase
VPALVALACHCAGTSHITGTARLRHKESDRVSALAGMLRALGGKVAIDDDGLAITGTPLRGGTIETRSDHRIAMAAAVAALRSESGVTIDDPASVNKSYPRFFDDLLALGARR